MQPRKIELLAPAKDCTVGMAAINHGADAVYIGGPQFSARASAGNTIDEIRRLIDHAHLFHARVYVALNTLLNDGELQEARDIIHSLHGIGTDALIIQDMGLLECNLPPIPLHASTQTDNRSPAKVKFLQDVGFSRVVLARELSLKEIAGIRAATSVSLEFFVHGALCVSYSGRCAFSEKVSGRSANRGRCAQFCRHSYTLRDGKGAILKDNSYLLSLQDLDLSAHLQALLAAGISSLKIEGRLKDIDYVKNVTAFYRRALDEIIDRDETFVRASSGRCTFAFTPDPERTFHRGGCEYFLAQKNNRVGALKSPKSTGKKIGQVLRAQADFFEVETGEQIANGDGLCFFDGNDHLVGLRVNRVQGEKIFPRNRISIETGTTLYRNFDIAFHRLLQKSNDCRKLAITLTLAETAEGLSVAIVDEDGCASSRDFALAKERAKDAELMDRTLNRQMAKSGGTIFTVQQATINIPKTLYLSLATINHIRRKAFDHHMQVRLAQHGISQRPLIPNSAPWPADCPLPSEHRANRKAEDFFTRHGVDTLTAEASQPETTVLMTCRYCLKAELGFCKTANRQSRRLSEPLTITDKTGTYELAFNCKRCEMQVMMRPNPHFS
jgi:23S rRNA 5-hydroxycytidine C2501 synthase